MRIQIRAVGLLALVMPILVVAGCPLSTNTNSNSNSSSLVGDRAVGETIYADRCASCHSLGTFDTSGSAGNLHGHGGLVISNLASYGSSMRGITLSAQDVADLKAFVQAN